MSPAVYSGSGGCDKSNFMISRRPLQKLETETSPAMAKLLIRLHELLGERYTKCATEGATVDTTQSNEVLNKHEGVLTLLHNAICDGWWPKCDPAEPQELAVSTRSLIGTCATKRPVFVILNGTLSQFIHLAFVLYNSR